MAPFRHRNFRYFFLVQTLSLSGQWSHDLARAWIVLELLGKASALGFLQMSIAIPSLIFILQGGILVDRANVKGIMMLTKCLLGVSALILAALTEFSEVKFWMLIIFGLIEGGVMGFDLPAYQALTVRLVPREDFQQALALNSTNFHTSRMLGPLIAGLLMAWHGPSLVFLFDSVTYFILVYVLSKIDLLHVHRSEESLKLTPLESLKKGFQYIRNTTQISHKVLQLFLTVGLIVPVIMVIFRTFVQKKFNLSAEEFGYAFTLPAAGSMMGALSFALFKPEKPIRALWFGIPAVTLGTLLVLHAPTIWLASITMAFTGFSMYLSLASLTVSLHLSVEEDYRGRLGAVIGLAFTGIGPLMGLPLGAFADVGGFETAVRTIVAIYFAGSVLLGYLYYSQDLRNPKLAKNTNSE
ncbi:MAG: MFS transporter [Bdellovibrionales bacterium]|nr:MFS transporter [Bdellovibrionales bacterium]